MSQQPGHRSVNWQYKHPQLCCVPFSAAQGELTVVRWWKLLGGTSNNTSNSTGQQSTSNTTQVAAAQQFGNSTQSAAAQQLGRALATGSSTTPPFPSTGMQSHWSAYFEQPRVVPVANQPEHKSFASGHHGLDRQSSPIAAATDNSRATWPASRCCSGPGDHHHPSHIIDVKAGAR